MSHYFTKCPECGALLDPCEVCDCKKDAAPDAGTIENGKNVLRDITNVSENTEKNKGDFPTAEELKRDILKLTDDERHHLYEMCKAAGLIKEV